MEQDKKNSFLSGVTQISNFSTIALIIILIVAVFIIFNDRTDEPITDEPILLDEEENETDISHEEELNDETEEEIVFDDSLTIEDQDAGNSVLVSNLSLSEKRWVVIHEETNGKPGNILGARLFFENDTDGEVDLLRETKENSKYYAILYKVAERDKEQDRIFDTDRDLPLVKENGEMKTVVFNTY